MSLLAFLQETTAATAQAATQWWEHDLEPDLVRIPFWKIGAIQDGIPIRYYSLAYLLGLVFAWWFLRKKARERTIALDENGVADLIIPYALLGVMLGGRLGYVLFYAVDAETGRYEWLSAPWKIFQIWEGGMASHGGILGVLAAMWWFAKRRKVPLLHLLDLCCLTAPIGLFLGRVANFINGELWGRVGTVSWAVVFPKATTPVPVDFQVAHPELITLFQRGLAPRHPSQLYEALGEGLLLFLLLFALHKKLLPRPGALSGLFLLVYSVARIICEQFREPDRQLGYGWLGMTRGQILSLGMVIGGLVLTIVALRRPPVVLVPPEPREPPTGGDAPPGGKRVAT
ncbi:MAG: prolipoprotein diacylglyceryl transferase [Planctomycetes bacterium]|nr:prolipoprotein diacylglyceryl transferase [Planctomycetota bacterium]